MVYVAGGLAALVIGAELLVRGASRLAALAGISPLVVGLTIVACGTSAPELAVSVQASLSGNAGLTVGNVVGSNIFNILLILGLSAVIAPLTVRRQLVRLDVPIMIGVAFLCAFVCWGGMLSRLEGALFLGLFVVYLGILYYLNRRERAQQGPSVASPAPAVRGGVLPVLGHITLGIAGIVLLVTGARWLVAGAVGMAAALGVDPVLIGLTAVAAGTSLPELATSVVASLRGERDLAIGNVIGSNIFNLLVVLGAAALATPGGLPMADSVLHFDLPVMVAVAVLCLPIFISGAVVSRFEGGLLLCYFAAYMLITVLAYKDAEHSTQVTFLLAAVVLPATALLLLASLVRQPPSWQRLRESFPEELHWLARHTWRQARKVVILVTGGAVIAAGAAMLVLPGPGLVTIALGLLILATEFVWAQRFLKRVRHEIERAAQQVRRPPEQ
ncbi:MAG: calcium/sodium antiporter [Candidatus Hydrogenedentota bacterium]